MLDHSEEEVVMSAQENMNLIRAWVNATNHNDVQGVVACFDPDVEGLIVATDTTFKGIEGVRRAAVASMSKVGDQPSQGRKQITNVFASQEWVCAELEAEATITGPVKVKNVTVIPEGESRTFRNKVCVVAHIKKGKIDRLTEYWDSAAYTRGLGLDSATLATLYSSLFES